MDETELNEIEEKVTDNGYTNLQLIELIYRLLREVKRLGKEEARYKSVIKDMRGRFVRLNGRAYKPRIHKK